MCTSQARPGKERERGLQSQAGHPNKRGRVGRASSLCDEKPTPTDADKLRNLAWPWQQANANPMERERERQRGWMGRTLAGAILYLSGAEQSSCYGRKGGACRVGASAKRKEAWPGPHWPGLGWSCLARTTSASIDASNDDNDDDSFIDHSHTSPTNSKSQERERERSAQKISGWQEPHCRRCDDASFVVVVQVEKRCFCAAPRE